MLPPSSVTTTRSMRLRKSLHATRTITMTHAICPHPFRRQRIHLRGLILTRSLNLHVTSREYRNSTSRLFEVLQSEVKSYWNLSNSPLYSVGDKVWLNSRNISKSRPSDKAGRKLLGPLEIIEKLSDLVFRLDMPPTTEINNSFHVSDLGTCTEGHLNNWWSTIRCPAHPQSQLQQVHPDL
jgi:hypothetical protein